MNRTRPKIKICGITNYSDAVMAVEKGADLLGFNFYRESPRYVSPEDVKAIVDQIDRDRVLCVGVFVNESEETIDRISSCCGLDLVQLHGDETVEQVNRLAKKYDVVKAIRVGDDYEPKSAGGFDTHAILLDAYSNKGFGGTGDSFDWQLAKATTNTVSKLFLAGGLNPDNILDAIESVRPYGIDLCSGVEESKGIKSRKKMSELFTALKNL